MNGDLSLSQALGGLRIANPDDASPDAAPGASPPSPPPSSAVYSGSSTAVDIPGGLLAGVSGGSSSDMLDSSPATASHQPPSSQPSSYQIPRRPSHQPSVPHSQPELSRSSIYGVPGAGDAVSTSAMNHTSRQASQRDGRRPYNPPRQDPTAAASASAPLPMRTSSKGMGGGYASIPAGSQAPRAYAADSSIPASSEEWKDRGAAVGVRREVDANGRTVVRQVKKGVRDFSFGRILGEGSYSSVYLATDRQTLKEYAIKVLEKRHIIKEKKIKYVNIEKNTLNRLTEHPGVVRLYYTFQDEASLYYVLDLCNGGELLGVLKKTGTFDIECARFYSAQILDAIEYMHSRGVIHRDLKPENVLLDDQMHVKITDFGTAKLLADPRESRNADASDRGVPDSVTGGANEDGGRAASFVGTAEYVSPELLTHKNASKASDLWAFGCIVYQLLAGRPPFKAGSEYLTFQKIVNLEYEFPPGFPPAARDLVDRCLVLDPARRLTIEHIKNHEFFDGQQFGKALWRAKAPRLRPYVPPTQEPAIIQLNGYSGAAAPAPIARAPPPSQTNPPNGGSRPPRIITELPPPTQLDIEWSPVLTRNNERILRLGDLMVLSAPLPHSPNGKGPEEGHKKLSRFFGGSTTRKRNRLVMVTSSGRIVLAPAGGEEKRAKLELSLLAPDCTWRCQQDAKGQYVWCVDTGGNHYTFEETKASTSSDGGQASAEEWVESLERARDMTLSQQSLGGSYSSDNGLPEMSSQMSSPSSTLGGRSNFPDGFGDSFGDGFGVSDRSGRHHLSKSSAGIDDPTPPKRHRFSKRQSRNGLDSAF